LYILEKYYGSVTNTKGFRVLNNVRVIQGDGIDHASIRSILFCMEMAGFSADNVAFGQGGALLQQVNRDTMKFAMKCSAIGVRERYNGSELVWRDVFKDPITDHGKASKKGRVTLMKDSSGEYYSGVEDWTPSELLEVFRDGVLVKEYTFDEVRTNARS
jgi:nicotinamide phosphoribosyltransferase